MKISVKVTPYAKTNEVFEDGCDLFGLPHFRVKTTAAAEDGKANEAVIELLAEFFGIKKNQIKISAGLTSRIKSIEIIK